MLGKIFDKILAEDEKEPRRSKKKTPAKRERRDVVFSLLVLALALGIRLYFLFFIEEPENSHPGWYEDTYHHWQIAWLSYQVGFKESFLRLWDLKGMEYFWGLLHPLILGGLMSLLGSPNIIIARILSLVCGSLNVALVYLLVKRYCRWQAGLAAALIAALNPVGIYSDASGMQEPLGILMFLLGMIFWPRQSFWAGFFWMLAGMVRAEYWLMGLGLMFVLLFSRQSGERKVIAWAGYGLTMLLYMKYLLDKTGNAIYPMYWNFLGNMKGEWQADILPSPSQLLVQKVYIGILVAVGLFSLLLLWKRPSSMVFFFLGLGNWLILSLSVGLSQYLLSYIPRFWVDRVMVLPYIFVGVCLACLLFKVFGRGWLCLAGWLLVLVIVLGSQQLWQPIWYWRGITKGQWEAKKALAGAVAERYQGGRLLFFEDHPASTYWLVRYHQVPTQKIIGQMFDPYFYMEGDPYLNWGENREIVFKWLKQEDIRLMAFFDHRDDYLELIRREPQYFEELGFDRRWNLYLYRVKPDLIEAE